MINLNMFLINFLAVRMTTTDSVFMGKRTISFAASGPPEGLSLKITSVTASVNPSGEDAT